MMFRLVYTLLIVGSLGLLPAFLGCDSGYPPLGVVEGTVTFQGEPLPDATVVFLPVDGRVSRGKTNAQGEYELLYIDDVKGAVLGKHRVQIVTRQLDESDNEIVKEKLPAQYNTKTTLTADVKSGGSTINFDLK